MHKLILIFVATLSLGITGCASKTIPSIDDLHQLNQQDINTVIIGNTLTYEAVWGRWAEYYSTNNIGYGSAWSTLFNWFGWQEESATASFDISDSAVICRRYDGEGAWANPEYKYCAKIYSKDDKYYLINTQNPLDPKIVGVPREIEIRQGDYYRLSQQN